MSARDVILVTGGAGYVGSHFVRSAVEAGSRVIALDDLSGVRAWPALPGTVERVQGDVADRSLVREIVKMREVTAVVHFAGKICVGASVADPAPYFDHNLRRTIDLLDVVREADVRAFVLSSSAAVYGEPRRIPVTEDERYAPVNPYGATKLAAEYALASYGQAYGIRWAALRYFNASGAHPDGTLRESHDPETHLIPLAIDATLGRCPRLSVFGDDYPTRDGTCARDYVHVCDLARAHLDAIAVFDRGIDVGAVNLGSGTGRTVREVLQSVARVTKLDVPHDVVPRRAGDPANLIASNQHAKQLIGWQPTRSDLDVIVEDALRSRRDQ